MRKSEPDSKYFVKSLENEVLPVKINENRRKLCKLFTVWFPKGIDDVQILLGSKIFFRLRIFPRKSRIYQRILMIFFAKFFKIKSYLNNVATPILLNNKKHKILQQTCGVPKILIINRYVSWICPGVPSFGTRIMYSI